MSEILGRLIIDGELVIKTGIHIGGGNSSLEIGGIDSSVIKNHKGEPYIPGSSIKGKMRSLTELAYGKSSGEPCKCGVCHVCKIFGISAGKNDDKKETLPTRIIVRDAFLSEDILKSMKNKTGDFKDLEFAYTESKWENTINRLSSFANPRVLERVPEGAIFNFEMIYTIYNEEDIENIKYLVEGLEFLQDDYLGGNGTRGYGQVSFKNIKMYKKLIKNYKKELIKEASSLEEISKDYIEKFKKDFQL
ncbi:type III-A CRISPR-associated RAMP protein Csm3 [Clostridium sp. Marseille-QA1073]